MTDTQKPEALRLADEFNFCIEHDSIPSIIDIEKAAAELRRLYEENEALRKANIDCVAWYEAATEDAERYQKLKTMDWYVGPNSFWCDEAGGMREYENYNNGNELDTAIDAARGAK